MTDAFDLPKQAASAASGNSGLSGSDLLGEASSLAFGSPARPAAEPTVAAAATPATNTVKALDFGATQTPGTPATPVPFQGNSDGVDYYQFVLDTLLWKNKVRSAIYLVGGLIQAFLIHKLLILQIPIISGVSFLLLANLALNFLRSLVASRPSVSSQWSGSSLSRSAVYFFTEGVNASSAVLDKHLSGTDPSATLKVAVSLWLVSLLARAVSTLSLMVTLYVAAFTLPLLYSMFKGMVDQTLNQGWSNVAGKFSQLDRLPRVGAVAVPTLLLALFLSKVDTAIAVLVVLIFLRSVLRPAEVDGLARKFVDPVSKTATAAGKAVFNFADATATRFDLTPTPSKKKAL